MGRTGEVWRKAGPPGMPPVIKVLMHSALREKSIRRTKIMNQTISRTGKFIKLVSPFMVALLLCLTLITMHRARTRAQEANRIETAQRSPEIRSLSKGY